MMSRATFSRALVDAGPRLFAQACRLAGNPDDAEDLVQTTMLKAWAARRRFEPSLKLPVWLFVILRNEHLTRARRGRWSHPGGIDDLPVHALPSAAPAQEAAVDLADTLAAMTLLPADQRRALELAGLGEKLGDAARLAGCAVGTMKSRTSRARDALRRAVL